ncbi:MULTISPECIES: ribbon-helix-helix domain-containing protein [Methylobacteriaceae]|uniref:ribbon-helix-helix domain-containing protein n=1 Tax=Methylobacteriaceae TaxID=119045 RepID=UPI00074F9A80|nr:MULTISPECIES: ribbon-helix-helix domain-containing protein [Methylobacteriaceae]AMB44389.1 arylsulfate sulfotransferase [Methylobacterium sp. AMS5]TFZ54888.1 aryl-sulfate sulfotransferase [Methylorubrum sp. Q1]
MCGLFSNLPSTQYDGETRSVRLGGHSTSIRLETMFWRVLEDLAASQDVSLPRFLTVLYDEVLDRHGEARNFTSLLRCACLTHLELQATGGTVSWQSRACANSQDAPRFGLRHGRPREAKIA